MQAVPAAAAQTRALDAPATSREAGFMGQHEKTEQPQAQTPSAGDCYDNYFMDQPWQDLCFVPVGCAAMMDQLFDQLQAGSGACSSSPARAAAEASSQSSGIASSAQLCSTDACTAVLPDTSATLVKTWCVMELLPDCVISFESNADDAAQPRTAQQEAAHGSSSGFSSSKAVAVQQQHQLLSSTACDSQYFSAAGMTAGWSALPGGAPAVGSSSQLASAVYHTMLACGVFLEGWQGCSVPAATAAPQREQQLHADLLQQQLQQQLRVDSYDSLAALPLDNPYKDTCKDTGRPHSNFAAGAECFVGEF